MEEAGLKENVNPGGGLWDPARRERKLRLRAELQELPSRARAGVLAPNSTLGNGGGGVDALEWLRGRVAQHKLASDCRPELDSGSRRHRLKGSSGKHSAGLSSTTTGRESSSAVFHPSPTHSRASLHSRNSVDHPERASKHLPFTSGLLGGAKSPWAATRGVIEIYQDDSTHSQGQRDSSRREVKSAERKSQGAGTGEQSEVSLKSPRNPSASKSERQHEDVCVKQWSPQASFPSVGSSGLWSRSTVEGTLYKETRQQSSNSGVDRQERSHREVASHERREVKVEAVETKSQGAGSLLASGLSVRSETEERCKVSLVLPSNAGAPKFELQEDQVCSKKSSPQPSSHRVGSGGLWNGSKVPGTPYKRTLHHSQSSLADRPGSSNRDQHFSSSGQAKGLNSVDSGNGRSSATSHDRRELSSREVEVEAIAKISPRTATASERSNRDQQCSSREQTAGGSLMKSENPRSSVTSYDRREVSRRVVKVEAAERISSGASVTLEELKFRIQQQTDRKSLYPRRFSNNVGSTRSSSSDKQVSSFPYALHTPEEAKVASSRDMETSQCEGTNLQELGTEDEKHGADFIVDLPHVSPQLHLQNVEHDKLDQKNSPGSSVAPCEEKIPKNGACSPEHRENQAFARTGSSPPPPKTQSAMTVTACPGSLMWSRSTTTSRSQAEDRYSRPEHGVQDDGTKWNMDTVGPDSALLSVEVTGASSSGSSATPCVIGSSPLDEDTGKSSNSVLPTPSFEKAPSSSKLSNFHTQRRARKSLGPPLRVLRDDAESCNSRISPVCVMTPVFGGGGSSAVAAEDEVDKTCGQLEYPRSDPKKRKVERDPSGGKGDASQILEHSTSALASVQEKEIEGEAVHAQRQQCARGPMGMESMPRERPSQETSKEDTGEAVDMSHDSLLSQENKENLLIPVVPDLSSCLSSLSLGEEDMAKKDESKGLSSNSISPIPSVAISNQLTTLKSVENFRASPRTSQPECSVISIDTKSRDQVRNSPCPPENNAVGLPRNAEVEVKMVRSDGAQDSRAIVRQLSHGTGIEHGQGATAASQTKTFENANFVWVNNMRYQKIGKIGKGGSSEVFKVIDSNCTIYALKKIKLKGREHRAALGFYQEIEYLERFLGKRNVIQLINYEVTDRAVLREDYEEEKILEDACIYMVLECGEIDLAGILSKKRKAMMESNEFLDEDWLKFYWKQMLLAVKTIHDERIVHADLKPANFLLVQGELKLIDFGIAKAIQNDTTHIVRDSQVGTLNYMSPEAFMANSMDEEGRMVKCGRASDIWSLGCILYQMVYGHTPFANVQSFYSKIQAITSKNHKIEFQDIPNPWLLDVLKKCLTWDRYRRPQITHLLEHPFLRPVLANQSKVAV